MALADPMSVVRKNVVGASAVVVGDASQSLATWHGSLGMQKMMQTCDKLRTSATPARFLVTHRTQDV